MMVMAQAYIKHGENIFTSPFLKSKWRVDGKKMYSKCREQKKNVERERVMRKEYI